jgi:hypothetical protein
MDKEIKKQEIEDNSTIDLASYDVEGITTFGMDLNSKIILLKNLLSEIDNDTEYLKVEIARMKEDAQIYSNLILESVKRLNDK